jgi:hypothetical protein
MTTKPIFRHVFALAFFAGCCFSGQLAAWAEESPPGPGGGPGAGWSVLADSDNGFNFTLLNGNAAVGRVGIAGWGPGWAWAGISGKQGKGDGGYEASGPFVVNRASGQVIEVTLHVAQSDPRSLTFRYDLAAEKEVPLTLLSPTIGIDAALSGSFMVSSDGKEATAILPMGKGAYPAVNQAWFRVKDLGDLNIRIDPPITVGIDHDARFILGQERFAAGSKSVSITLVFPRKVSLLNGAADVARFTDSVAGPGWWAFATRGDASVSGDADVIGMQEWLETPAGKRGGVRVAGDEFHFEDGSPVKFWGTNLAYGNNCAPEKSIADFTAARFARYGINAVRLHKFSYPNNANGIGDPNDSTRMDEQGIDRLDYFSAQLKKNGVYFGWSHTYGLHVRPGDKGRLVAYDEVRRAYPDGNTYAFINFAPDVQDLLIEMVVNLLKHKSPYTGLIYADEPALCFLEMQNEDDIFFYTSEKALAACPTYRKLFVERFADWLKNRYASEDALAKAWEGAIQPGESLSARNLVPQVNPWFFSDSHLPQTRGGERQRLLDTAAFLHAAQNEFYGKYLKAIRNAGYKGPVIGSPWQGPSMLPHYYNLRSDYLAGYIDRHNYFGEHLEDSMLARPGSGYLSTGLQQVVDRPFGLSEWITVYPSLYSADGPALIAAYGMGLQGWDASYEFQSQAGTKPFDDTAGTLPWGVWEADTPTQLGQYPSLARMIYRGDVKQGPLISVRRISPGDLADGKFSFSDKVTQQGDVKDFAGGNVPPEALAAGRVAVEFTQSPQPSLFPELAKYVHDKAITSATSQLTWDYSGRGYFTINTPGTKAVVGFAPGKTLTLEDVRITPDCPYASIVLTALDKGSTLATGKSALLTAVARSCNSGFRYFTPGKKVLENGKGPILMEPVKASIAVGRQVSAVNVLDVAGRRTGQTLPVRDGSFSIDGARDKTMYYEVVFR